MNSTLRFVAALLVLTAALTSHAQVKVENAWIRATVPAQKATGAFMQLTSPTIARLVAASSTAAPHVEVHEMAMENDVMKMRQISAVELPAGKSVELKPGGYHIMLLDLKQQMKAGDVVPLTLTLEKVNGQRENVEIQVPVRPLNAGAEPAARTGHNH